MSSPHTDGRTFLYQIVERINDPVMRRYIEGYAQARQYEDTGIIDLMAARDAMNLLYYMTLQGLLPPDSDTDDEDRKAARAQVIATAQAWEDALLRIAQILPLVPYIRQFRYLIIILIIIQLVTLGALGVFLFLR